MNPLAWADLAIIIGLIAWGIRDYLRGDRNLWRLAEPTPTEEEALRQALHAHDEDMDQLMRQAGLSDSEFETALREWQARQ